jgi:myo-inositol-1(or 4)-monophosphatase
MDIQQIQKDIEKFIVTKGDFVYDNWHRMSIDKLKDGGADVSTNFDREIEKEFYDLVSREYSEFGFRGEELPELNKDGEYTWMIDPIDGTKFFAAGVPLWSNTVALVDSNNEALIGIIYNPISKQLYSASKGNGAYLNGKQIFLTKETDIQKLQVSIDLSSTKQGEYDFTDRCHKSIDMLERNFYRARLLGSGALSLAWLAQGFFGAFVDPVRTKEKMVDIAGGLCIAKEAGAIIDRIEVEKDIFDTIVARKEVVEQIKKLLV